MALVFGASEASGIRPGSHPLLRTRRAGLVAGQTPVTGIANLFWGAIFRDWTGHEVTENVDSTSREWISSDSS